MNNESSTIIMIEKKKAVYVPAMKERSPLNSDRLVNEPKNDPFQRLYDNGKKKEEKL